ncbi:MAG: hypothetical protein ABI823_07335, partial [Bryobacteraceae bacterium]
MRSLAQQTCILLPTVCHNNRVAQIETGNESPETPDRQSWEDEVASVKRELGLTKPVLNAVDVCLPALDPASNDGGGRSSTDQDAVSLIVPVAETLQLWAQRWINLATFSGPHLRDPTRRINQILELWDLPLSGTWE